MEYIAHAQTVCTRPLLGGEGPGDEAKSGVDQGVHAFNLPWQSVHRPRPCINRPFLAFTYLNQTT